MKLKMSGYGRVSTDEEKQLDSLDHQKEFFEDFARRHSYELYEVYADEGITGRQLKKRDEFLRMMRDAELKLFDVLVVKDVSRFARNTVDLLTSIRKLKAIGIEVIFVNNSQKVLGESEFVITLLGAMAQEESANLSKRVKFGKEINAKKGRVPPRIYGYNRIDNFTLEINEEEAAVVREIFRLYIDEGFGCRLIALELERQNAITKLGGQWNSRGIRRVLVNPIYCGRFYNHKYTITDFLEGTRKALPADQYFFHERPEWAIISEERFDEAQRVLEKRRKQYENKYTHKTGRYSNRHLFSTLIKCETCGRSFSRRVVKYPNSTYIYWRCPTNNSYTAERCANNTIIREDDLIKHITQYLTELVADKDAFIQAVQQKYEEKKHCPKESEINIKALATKKNRLNKQIEKYTEMYANDVISMEALKEKVSSLREEITVIDKQLTYNTIENAEQKSAEQQIKMMYDTINDFLSLKNATNTDLRKIVSAICVNDQKEVTIHLAIEETLGI